MDRERIPWKSYGRYGTVGFELLLSLIFGYWAGHWLDQHFHANGWITVAGVLIGLYAGFRSLYKAAKFMEREAERDLANGERLPNLWGENDWAESGRSPMKRDNEADASYRKPKGGHAATPAPSPPPSAAPSAPPTAPPTAPTDKPPADGADGA